MPGGPSRQSLGVLLPWALVGKGLVDVCPDWLCSVPSDPGSATPRAWLFAITEPLQAWGYSSGRWVFPGVTIRHKGPLLALSPSRVEPTPSYSDATAWHPWKWAGQGSVLVSSAAETLTWVHLQGGGRPVAPPLLGLGNEETCLPGPSSSGLCPWEKGLNFS